MSPLQAWRILFEEQVLMPERFITLPEVEEILCKGHREPKKDEWKEEHKAWNYAMRHKTIDERNLRIAVTPNEIGLLVITVIDLDKSGMN